MKKKKTDVLEIFGKFRQLIENKPATGKMFEEVRMMKFKVHPVAGDISAIDLHNKELIETLWSLGKLDELFQADYKKLSKKEKQVFLQFFENLHERLQEELNKINLKTDINSVKSSILEFEIFKDQLPKKQLN